MSQCFLRTNLAPEVTFGNSSSALTILSVLHLSVFESYFEKEHILYFADDNLHFHLLFPASKLILALFPRLPVHINNTILEKLFGCYEHFIPENSLTFISA